MSCAPEVIQPSKPKGFGAGLARRFSFSAKKCKMNQRFSLTGKKGEQRRPSLSSLSTSSVSSNFLEDDRIVRFATKDKRGKKIKAEIIEFERVPTKEVPLNWYSQVDMEAVLDDVRNTVRHFTKNCDRYITNMNKIADSCEVASLEDHHESVTRQFDSRVIAQLAQSNARGLEHLIAPRMDHSRKQVVESVIRTQAALSQASPEKREKLLAAKYAQLSHSAKLMAKTMADGDAMAVEGAAKPNCR